MMGEETLYYGLRVRGGLTVVADGYPVHEEDLDWVKEPPLEIDENILPLPHWARSAGAVPRLTTPDRPESPEEAPFSAYMRAKLAPALVAAVEVMGGSERMIAASENLPDRVGNASHGPWLISAVLRTLAQQADLPSTRAVIRGAAAVSNRMLVPSILVDNELLAPASAILLEDLRGGDAAASSVAVEILWGVFQYVESGHSSGDLETTRQMVCQEIVQGLISLLGERGRPNPQEIVRALQIVTGQDFGMDAAQWRSWWEEQRS
jgi:hypothetical protein